MDMLKGMKSESALLFAGGRMVDPCEECPIVIAAGNATKPYFPSWPDDVPVNQFAINCALTSRTLFSDKTWPGINPETLELKQVEPDFTVKDDFWTWLKCKWLGHKPVKYEHGNTPRLFGFATWSQCSRCNEVC